MNTLFVVIDPLSAKAPAHQVDRWATSANFDTLPEAYRMVFKEMIASGATEAQPMIVRFMMFDLMAIYKVGNLPKFAFVRGISNHYFRTVNLFTGSVSCNYDIANLEKHVRGMVEIESPTQCALSAPAPAQLQ